MTDSQLLTIVIANVACNIALLAGFASIINTNVNVRISDLRSMINDRFDRFEKVTDEKIKDIEHRVHELERKVS